MQLLTESNKLIGNYHEIKSQFTVIINFAHVIIIEQITDYSLAN